MAHFYRVRHQQFKLVMAHCDAVRHQQFCKKKNKKKFSTGALLVWCAITSQNQYWHTSVGCAISMYVKMKKKISQVAHLFSGAPLVSSTLMTHHQLVRHQYIVVAHYFPGAPLVSILSIALFQVVCSSPSIARAIYQPPSRPVQGLVTLSASS